MPPSPSRASFDATFLYLIDVDAQTGLSSAEAARRLAQFGPNDPAPTRGRHHLRIVGAFVSNPLVLVLLAAAGVSFAVGDRVNSAIVAGLVIFSVALDS